MGVVLRAHPVRGESHIQRNANGVVATPAMEIVFSFCMHRVAKKFKQSFLKHCFINIQFLQLESKTMTFYIAHPTVNLPIVYVTVCYLFMLLLLCIQLHD